MKRFGTYQYVEGNPMTERDKQEIGSKFWNEGKWNNFIAPFLPENCDGLTLVDMGCNAGLFLKLAEDRGFNQVIGVDANKEAFNKALAYRERNGGRYQLQRRYMEKSLDYLPVADFTIFANSHYYWFVKDWVDYVDKLKAKTRYIIIVTAKKRVVRCKTSAETANIRDYFKDWGEVGIIDNVTTEDDPFPRDQWSICFKSPILERVPIDSLETGNGVQEGYWRDLDNGIDPLKTRYYKILKHYRRGHKWPEKRTIKFMYDKKKTFESLKESGLLKPIIADSTGRIYDGNHRYDMMKYLGYESVLIRRVL